MDGRVTWRFEGASGNITFPIILNVTQMAIKMFSAKTRRIGPVFAEKKKCGLGLTWNCWRRINLI